MGLRQFPQNPVFMYEPGRYGCSDIGVIVDDESESGSEFHSSGEGGVVFFFGMGVPAHNSK